MGKNKQTKKRKTCKETNDTKTRTSLCHCDKVRLYSILFEAKPTSHSLHSNDLRVTEITTSSVSEIQS